MRALLAAAAAARVGLAAAVACSVGACTHAERCAAACAVDAAEELTVGETCVSRCISLEGLTDRELADELATANAKIAELDERGRAHAEELATLNAEIAELRRGASVTQGALFRSGPRSRPAPCLPL